MSAKDPCGMIIQDSFKEFVTHAVGGCMVHCYVVINMLLAVQEIQAVNIGIPIWAVEPYIGIVPNKGAIEREVMRFHFCLSLKVKPG